MLNVAADVDQIGARLRDRDDVIRFDLNIRRWVAFPQESLAHSIRRCRTVQ